MPLLAPVLGIGAEAGYEPVPAEGRKLYELIAQAVQAYLLACLGDGAGLVVAEDVHWFDPSTLEVLGALLRCGRGPAAGGHHRTPRWVAAGQLAGQGVRPGAVDRRADRRADHRAESGLTADERAAVAGRCDGVPFYIEQVVAGLSRDRGARGAV